MGVLIDGTWRDGELPQETGGGGDFRRADSRFRDRITADGSSGFKAEPGRYHLYVAHGCPWAHRTLIFRAQKKLDGAITVAYSVPGIRPQGWEFRDDPKFPDCTPDNAEAVARAGANVLVAGSAAFKGGPSAYAKNIAAIRNAAAMARGEAA